MSDEIFPPTAAAISIAWSNTRTAMFTTLIRTTSTHREHRVSSSTLPRWRWLWQYKKLSADGTVNDALRAVVAFFLERRGAYDSFLIKDTEDYAMTDQVIGLGTGSKRAFQIIRTYSGAGASFVEPIENIKLSTLSVQKQISGTWTNQTLTTDYVYSGAGIITFNADKIPADGQGVRVTLGEFYRRVRFETDEQEMEQFLMQLWRLQEVRMLSVDT